MPVPFFKCVKCGRTFDSFEGAEACENAHPYPVSVEIKSHSIRPFPYSVEITFSNGERRIYNAEDLGG